MSAHPPTPRGPRVRCNSSPFPQFQFRHSSCILSPPSFKDSCGIFNIVFIFPPAAPKWLRFSATIQRCFQLLLNSNRFECKVPLSSSSSSQFLRKTYEETLSEIMVRCWGPDSGATFTQYNFIAIIYNQYYIIGSCPLIEASNQLHRLNVASVRVSASPNDAST